MALIPARAQADDGVDPYALTPEQLFDATVISASRVPENIWQAPTAIFVISASDIQRSGATTIAEALRLAPGVQVARINSSGWAVSVRGFNSALTNKLLVLIDGREVYDPLFSGVYWEVQDTPLQDIDRIEVIRGPGASLWGANAVNGVINIITKAAQDTQGLLLSATGGNFERNGLTIRYGGGLGGNAHWRAYAEGFDRAGQESLAGGGDNSDWNALRGGFRFDYAPSAQDQVTVQGDIYHSETGQLRAVPMLTAPYADIVAEDIIAEGGNVLARWARQTSDGGHATIQTYIDFTRRDQLPLEDRRTTFDIDAQYEFPVFGAHALVAGLRYRTTSDDIRQTPIITSASMTHREQLFSAFAQDQIALSETWRLTVGSKFDQNDYTGFEIQPTVRLQWMGERQMAWAAVSRAVRTPSELEREFDVVTGVIPPNIVIPVPVSVELRPNQNFESEEVVAYEIGYRRQWTADVAMDIAAFHNDYSGLATLTLQAAELDLSPLHFILPILTTNSTSAQTQGVEMTLNWRARENLNLVANYSFLDMELHGPPPAVAIASEVAETQSPRNQASLRIQWDASDRLALDTTTYYVDNIPAFQIHAYVRTDLRLGYRLTDRLQVELVGQDVFDENHREFGSPADANAADIGRSIFGRLTWRS